nr:hypothetical protein [Bacillaceae bacterium]
MEKTIRPQLRREGAASAPEKWDGTYTGILESMDSGEKGREPDGEMGEANFPIMGRTQGRLRPSFIRKTRLSGQCGNLRRSPLFPQQKADGGGLGRRPIDGGKTTVIRLICF